MLKGCRHIIKRRSGPHPTPFINAATTFSLIHQHTSTLNHNKLDDVYMCKHFFIYLVPSFSLLYKQIVITITVIKMIGEIFFFFMMEDFNWVGPFSPFVRCINIIPQFFRGCLEELAFERMLCNIIEIRRAMRRKKFLSSGTARPAVGR